MSNDDTLSPKEMDDAVDAAEAHTREVLAEGARRERQKRVDRVNVGLSKVLPLAAPRPAHVNEADAELAKALRQQVRTSPTNATLAAAESYLETLGFLPDQA